MSKLFRVTLLLSLFFGLNKIVALVRQALIAREFGLSPAIDAFNVANNVPDLLFSLISGGAIALAFIPVLTEYIDKKGRDDSWVLFSRIANLVFVSTAFLSLIIALFAKPLVSSQFGIAPGFTVAQQALTAQLMQLNLIATLIFSISGLVMAALQSHKSFILTAIAPILYNAGQIFGALVIAPVFHLGVFGLAIGVIIGAVLHLAVQIPGLIHYGFKWTPSFGVNDTGVRKVMRLMGPRILTVLFIQVIFLTRDNLASRLQEGAVSALTYGYFILQVPETLIGTAIATALLPSLSHYADEKQVKAFEETLLKSVRSIFAVTVVLTLISSLLLDVLIRFVFHFSEESSVLLSLTTKAYLIGLLGQCLLEILTRAFYAQQDSRTPFWVTFSRMLIYIGLCLSFFKSTGVVGLAIFDSVTVSFEAGLLYILLSRSHPNLLQIKGTLARTFAASVLSVLIIYIILYFSPLPSIISVMVAFILSMGLSAYIIRKELWLLIKI